MAYDDNKSSDRPKRLQKAGKWTTKIEGTAWVFNWKTFPKMVVYIISIKTNKQPSLQAEGPVSASWLFADLQTPGFV